MSLPEETPHDTPGSAAAGSIQPIGFRGPTAQT